MIEYTPVSPEPNGYLHIGSAYAINISYSAAQSMVVYLILDLMIQIQQRKTMNMYSPLLRI